MSHEEHISRMQAEGLINERQADLLRGAVQAGPPAAVPRNAAKRLLPMLMLAVVLTAVLLFWPSGPEPEMIQDISQTLNVPGSTGNMNRTLSASLSIALILLLPLAVVVWLYNSLVGKEEKTLESWAQVEASYQRRADLIPALVETVAKYAGHEQSTLTQIAESRAVAGSDASGKVDQLLQAQKQATEKLHTQAGKTPTDEAMLAALANAQALVGNSARQLLAVAESYPQLRASDQFLELQAQFEGAENRILTARSRFNEAVEDYNGAIRKLPGSLIASLGRFQRKAYFRADSGSGHTPERPWN